MSDDLLPTGQQWLISRMRSVGLCKIPINGDFTDYEGGVCFGVTAMAMQASLADEIELFNKRLLKLHSMPVETIKNNIDEAKEKQIQLIQRIKKEVGPFRKLTAEEFDLIKNQENILSFEHDDVYLFDAYIQYLIDKKTDPEVRELLDCQIFMEDVWLYQRSYDYLYLFPENERYPRQDVGRVLSLLSPAIFQEKNRIQNLETLGGGPYASYELTKMLEIFEKLVLNASPVPTQNISFFLSSGTHAVTITFNAKSKDWTFIDANQLPSISHMNSLSVSNAIINAFSDNHRSMVSFLPFVENKNHDIYSGIIQQWRNDINAFPPLSEFAPEKINRTDSNGNSLLHFAIYSNDLKLLKEILLNKHVDINLKNKQGHTALMIATAHEAEELVSELILNGADLNFGKFSLLEHAASRGDVNIVRVFFESKKKISSNLHNDFSISRAYDLAGSARHTNVVNVILYYFSISELRKMNDQLFLYKMTAAGKSAAVNHLLSKGLNPKQIYDDNMTLLHAAVKSENSELIKLFLELGVDPNIAKTPDSLTPLFLAAQNGLKDSVILLLANNANPMIEFKTSMRSLTDLTLVNNIPLERSRQFYANHVFHKHHSVMDLYISPYEIALLMNHTEVAELIAEAMKDKFCSAYKAAYNQTLFANPLSRKWGQKPGEKVDIKDIEKYAADHPKSRTAATLNKLKKPS